MEIIEGRITSYDERGRLVIAARYDNADRLCKRQYQTVLIGLQDGRTITPEQRKKAYALINEIADWSGNLPEYLKELTKLQVMTEEEIKLGKKIFSLSDCSIETASRYIAHLVDMILYYDVPTKVPLYELCDDVSKYMFACLRHKKCAVCGKRGELHHVDRVGMGHDRTDVCHEGMEAMSLCREHHNEVHNIGEKVFFAKYHFDGGVVLNKELCKIYKLKARVKSE